MSSQTRPYHADSLYLDESRRQMLDDVLSICGLAPEDRPEGDKTRLRRKEAIDILETLVDGPYYAHIGDLHPSQAAIMREIGIIVGFHYDGTTDEARAFRKTEIAQIRETLEVAVDAR